MLMNKFRMLYCAVVVLTGIAGTSVSYADQQSDGWAAYVDGSIGRNFYYLYQQAMYASFKEPRHYRALSLGAGAGDPDVDLAAKGWDVTSVDLSTRSSEVIKERMKFVNGSYQFQQADFAKAKLNGNYDFILSFFALPFGNKTELPELIKNISQHTKSGAVFAFNLFGPEHTFVKKGQCYAVTKDEISQLLSANGFEVKFLLNRRYDQQDFNGNNTFWDLLDVIAVKS